MCICKPSSFSVTSNPYTVDDIALILRLPKAKVNKWLNKYWQDYYWGINKNKAINFLSLIEFYVFYQLKEKGFSTQKIQQTHKLLIKILKNNFPFANANILTLDDKHILYKPEKDLLLKLDNSLQFVIKEIIEPFCKKIEYDTDQTAKRFYPDGLESNIVIDPQIKFGAPVIKGTGIMAETIYLYYKGGEKIDFIASIFEISEKDVTDSIRFVKHAA